MSYISNFCSTTFQGDFKKLHEKKNSETYRRIPDAQFNDKKAIAGIVDEVCVIAPGIV